MLATSQASPFLSTRALPSRSDALARDRARTRCRLAPYRDCGTNRTRFVPISLILVSCSSISDAVEPGKHTRSPDSPRHLMDRAGGSRSGPPGRVVDHDHMALPLPQADPASRARPPAYTDAGNDRSGCATPRDCHRSARGPARRHYATPAARIPIPPIAYQEPIIITWTSS